MAKKKHGTEEAEKLEPAENGAEAGRKDTKPSAG